MYKMAATLPNPAVTNNNNCVAPMETGTQSDKMTITLQMGVHKELVFFTKSMVDSSLEHLRQRARKLVVKHSMQKDDSSNTADNVMLFKHEYASTNMLQLLQSENQLINGAVIEVVLSSKDDHPSRPHVLAVNSYLSPTFCEYCGEILVGLVKQGLKCERCGLSFHKKCAYASQNNCQAAPLDYTQDGEGSTAVSMSASESAQQFALPHTFVVHSYRKPTVCKVCNGLLVGLIKQGLQCRDCKVNVHKRCAAHMPNDCRCAAGHVQFRRSSQGEDSGMDTDSIVTTTTTDESQADDPEDESMELIPVQRLPGLGSVKHSRPPPVSLEGWMLHFTNRDVRRLRHYWVLEPACVSLYHEGLHRKYGVIPLSEIVGLKPYEGAPLDPSYPPHCFEIQTKALIFYVGENLDWYKKQQAQQASAVGEQAPPVAKLPRRESGVGLASALKWLEGLGKALLPPPGPRENAATPQSEVAFEFSQIYQVPTTVTPSPISSSSNTFSFPSFWVNPNEELGSGQFGTVYGGVHRSSGGRVAVKVIAKERFGKKQKEQLKGEVAILQAVSHPGIIKLEAMFETKDKIFVVMEQMKADMLEMILSSRNGRLTERVTKFLMWQILTALKYLHSKDIAHCDLKPENVLLSSGETAFPQTKLCDFGYARFIGESQFRNTVVGTPAYLAPEVLLKKGYNKSLDMWSVAVVVYVTLSGTFPFNEGEEIAAQIQNASFMYPADPWRDISRPAQDLISRLLRVQIEERLNIEECIAHEWLQDHQLFLDLKELETRLGIRYLISEEFEQRWQGTENMTQ